MQFACSTPGIGNQLTGAPWASTLAVGATPIWEIQTDPTTSLSIIEIVARANPTGGTYTQIGAGLGRPAAQGVGLYPFNVLGDDSGLTNPTPTVKLFCNWSIAPTVPANFLRRKSLGSNGAEVIVPSVHFRFPMGLIVPPSSSLVLWFFTPAGATAGILLEHTIVMDA